ncbi:MAG: hypothetical protein U0234_28555 [Sandaracinus sp.]
MSLPARAWIAGHGLVLVPLVPFEVVSFAGPDDRIALVHHAPGGARSMLVVPDPSGGDAHRIAFQPAGIQAGDVVEFVDDDERSPSPRWRVVTRALEHPLPARWSAWSTDEAVSWPCELTPRDGAAARDAMIYVQGPWGAAHAPPLDAFVAAGMRDAGRERSARGDSVRLAYTHDGVAWHQIRHRVWLDADAVVLVTAQAPASELAVIEGAVAEIVLGLCLRSDDTVPQPASGILR